MIPNQVIPQEEKSEKWAETTALSIMNASISFRDQQERTNFCYKFYNGEFDQSDYDYLRKSGEYEYPALVRNIPLLKTMFNNLKSQEIKRPFLWQSYTTDKASIDRKKEDYTQAALAFLEERTNARIEEVQQAQDSIANMEQQIQAAQQEGKEISPVTLRELQAEKAKLDKRNLLNKEEVADFERKYRLKYRDLLEMISQKGLTYLVKTQDAKMKFNQMFEDKIVSERPVAFIDCSPYMRDPKLMVLDPNHFYYSKDDVDWISQCQWAFYDQLVSIPALVDRFPKISSQMLKEIENSNFTLLDYSGVNFHQPFGVHGDNAYYNSNELRGRSVRLSHVYWMSPRLIYFYTLKDEQGKEFEQVTDKKSKIPKGAEYEQRYLNELWTAKIVDGRHVIEAKKVRFIVAALRSSVRRSEQVGQTRC
jgi:hypothetical protein